MKNDKESLKIIRYMPFLLFIVTFFGCIGYAEIGNISLDITGTVKARTQEGVFITDVENIDANADNSKINYYTSTFLDTTIDLDSNNPDSTISYQITLYNNSNEEYIFIDTITDKNDSTLYDNENIEFFVTGIEKYITTIAPAQNIRFTITFKYKEGADTNQNILNSKLNFRFKEKPKIELSNEGQTYTLNDIYPDYVAQEYQFTVSNYYSDAEINSVPMKYTFITTIDSPLVAKIYDSAGQEINDSILIDGDAVTQTNHNYTLKIIWDNSISGEGYNSSSYADKEFECNIQLKSIFDDENYMEYEINKEFNIDIKTATLNFYTNPTTASLTILDNVANLSTTIKNYSSNANYNKFDIKYEISIEENDKFLFSIDDKSPVNNVITRKLSGESKKSDEFDIKLMADMADLDITENLVVKIKLKSPYIKTIKIPVTITLHKVTVTLDANGGSVSTSSIEVYQNKTYPELPIPTYVGHTFNGWYTEKTNGTQIASSTTVTTSSSTQTLYAQWTSCLLADYVSVGDYVNYPVSYSNVATDEDSNYIAKSTYKGWRVLSIDGSGDNKYVRLITAGIPMTYVHPSASGSGTSSVTALTTNFFSTVINKSTATNYKFHRCGFVNSSGTEIGNISDLKTVFTNDYTQSSSGTPAVKSVTKGDIDAVWGSTTTNAQYLTSNDLLAIPSTISGTYASYYVATAYASNTRYLWNVYYTSGAIIYTYGEFGIRPVVSLKATFETTGKDSSGVWQIK